MQKPEPFGVIILAGGQGARLGQDKTTVLLGTDTLLAQTARNVATLTDDLVLVTRPDQPAPLGPWRLAYDLSSAGGLLAGVAGGLQAARYDWSLVIGCDMPFVSPELVRYLASLRGDWQVVAPRCAKGLEPLHAFYRRDTLPILRATIQRGERRLGQFLSTLQTIVIPESLWQVYDPEGRSFFNVNTPADLAQARRWWALTHEG